jgi:hypothetical protein
MYMVLITTSSLLIKVNIVIFNGKKALLKQKMDRPENQMRRRRHLRRPSKLRLK